MHNAFAYTAEDAWGDCDGAGAAPDWFEPALDEIMEHYQKTPRPQVNMPAKDRDHFYRKVDKAAQTLLGAMENVPDRIEWELQDCFTQNEPENVDQILTGEFEGMTYGEYALDRLKTALNSLQQHAQEAQSANKPARGKRKQNENLERTLSNLGALFQKVSGKEPMGDFYYDETDQHRPYKGIFLSFATNIIWAKNGCDSPSNAAIGEAARVVFGLRK